MRNFDSVQEILSQEGIPYNVEPLKSHLPDNYPMRTVLIRHQEANSELLWPALLRTVEYGSITVEPVFVRIITTD